MESADIEVIDPQKALMLLKANVANFRNPDMKRVDMYSKEMLAKKWEFNGDTIRISASGIVLDGQHRLMAIVKSGVTIRCIVVRGLLCDGRTIDRGKPRTVAQWCAHKKIKNSAHVAAGAKLILCHEKKLWGKQSIQSSDVLDSEIFDFIEENHNEIQRCVRMSQKSKHILSSSLVSAILFVGCDKKDPQECKEAGWFVDSIASGEMLTSEDAVFHLRNRLLSQRPQARMDAFMLRALATIAWNKTVKGETCSASGMRLTLAGPSKQKAPSEILKVNSVDY